MPLDIYQRRKELNLTLEDVGKAVGVRKSTVKKWESGYIKHMRRDKIKGLAEVLRVSPMDILYAEFNRVPSSHPAIHATKALTDMYNRFLNSAFKASHKKTSMVICTDNKFIFIDETDKCFEKIMEIL